MTKRYYKLAAMVLMTGLVQPAFATTEAATENKKSETQICTDCTQPAELARSRGEPVDQDIKELAAAIGLALKEQGIVAETPATTPTTQTETEISKSDFEEKLDELGCKDESDDYDQAMCLAANLDDIKEEMENLPKGKNKAKQRAKLAALYKRAQRIVKNELAQSYDVEDIEDRDEARERFEDLAGAIEDDSWSFANSDKRNSGLSRLKAGLEAEMTNRVTMTKRTQYFDESILPSLDQASYDLKLAADSGNLNAQYTAQTRYDQLMLQAQQYTKESTKWDPSGRLASIERYTDGASVDYFETYYKQSYQSILNSLREVGMNNIDQGLNDYSNASRSDVRQIRSAGFSSITSMPTYGSPYDNMMISATDPVSSMYDDNFASRFLDTNGSNLQSRGN